MMQDVLNDPLVICKAPVVGKTMMTSVEPRIKGLKQYVEKMAARIQGMVWQKEWKCIW